MITKEQHAALCRPFPVEDIEWKLIKVRDNGESGIVGRCSAFITAREVMARLDLVFGPGGWTSSVVPFEVGKEPGFVCRITAGGVYHEDVADLTDVEAVKGGASGALKRAAVHFGIGRYLYDLPKGGYIQVDPKGVFHGELRTEGTAGGKKRFSWNPPALPAWAIPDAVDIRVADSFVAIPIEFATAAKRMDPAKIKDKYLAVLAQIPQDMAHRPWSDRWDPMTRVDALLELRAQIALYEREHNVTLELK